MDVATENGSHANTTRFIVASLRIKNDPRSGLPASRFPMDAAHNAARAQPTKKQAQRIANEFEDDARAAEKGRFIESRARKGIQSRQVRHPGHAGDGWGI
jgi:hypothetical protein